MPSLIPRPQPSSLAYGGWNCHFRPNPQLSVSPVALGTVPQVEMTIDKVCLQEVGAGCGVAATQTPGGGKSLSRVQLFANPRTVALQAPLSMGFSRQEYRSGLPFPFPGGLSDPRAEPGSPALQADSLAI